MPTASVLGRKIAYEVTGEGPPLVLLHCWTGNKAFYFEQVERFSRDHRCITLDFPGHGDSGESDEYTVEIFGRITLALLTQLGIEKAVFAGHSLGGMVCFYIALEHPEMVEGLILLDTTPYLSGTLFQRVFAFMAVQLGHFGFKAGKAVVAGIAATHPLASPRSRVITGRECCKVSNRALVRTLDDARKFDVTKRLGEINAPALIIVGTADMLADLRHARKMAKGLPNSTMVVVHGAGHMALFERPEVVNEQIAVFLARVSPPEKPKKAAKAQKMQQR